MPFSDNGSFQFTFEDIFVVEREYLHFIYNLLSRIEYPTPVTVTIIITLFPVNGEALFSLRSVLKLNWLFTSRSMTSGDQKILGVKLLFGNGARTNIPPAPTNSSHIFSVSIDTFVFEHKNSILNSEILHLKSMYRTAPVNSIYHCGTQIAASALHDIVSEAMLCKV